MPDNSCRTCGGDLIKWSSCSKCRKVMQKICTTCSTKTIQEVHAHHIQLEPYQIVNTKTTVATVQSYHDHPSPKIYKKKKSNRNSILVISCVIAGVMILGILGTNHPESFPSSRPIQTKVIAPSENPDVARTIKQIPPIDTSHANTDNKIDVRYTYDNCLGISDGTHLTITCPTTYGNVYKAVVQIPSELMSQFENSVFSLRGISVTEHMDSISMQYAKKMYEAKFING